MSPEMPSLRVSLKVMANSAMTAKATMIPYHVTVRGPMEKAMGSIPITSIQFLFYKNVCLFKRKWHQQRLRLGKGLCLALSRQYPHSR